MPRSEPIRAVRGVRDILPAEMPVWRAAQAGAAGVAKRFGYEEIITPIIEHAELIERVGADTDAVAKELYRFDDRGGRNLALWPEATAGGGRAYFEGGLNQGAQPSRPYLFGPMFRYDRPQKGPYRQLSRFYLEMSGRPAARLGDAVCGLACALVSAGSIIARAPCSCSTRAARPGRRMLWLRPGVTPASRRPRAVLRRRVGDLPEAWTVSAI